MKLLSIKAHGFKSFADKIEINVGDGITGIVGPNGSGKSNVVDAVKWVLGEASLKEIRGGESMSDVIFSGSASRSPLTRAWVSLTFDNSDHYLASDLTEIEIKREVFKSGENDYYINNTKVRRKDITDLFLDSGSSSNSFSIISQGKISEILKGKPSDRRAIIEEASGVLKYKKRKEDTLKKLDNTNDNLEKVNLVIAELETNLEPLRLQADTATKYLSKKEELEGIEIALLASDIKNINDEYSLKKDSLKKLNDELMDMSANQNIDGTKLESLKSKSLRIDEDITKTSEKIISLSEQLSSLETRKQVISERQKYEVEDQKLQNNILILKDNEINIKKNISLLNASEKKMEEDKERELENLNKTLDEYNVLNIKKNTLNDELKEKVKREGIVKNQIELINDNLENDSKLPYAVKNVLSNPRLKGIHDVLCKVIDTEEKYVNALEVALGANANVIIVDDEVSGKDAINYLKDNRLGRATFFPISIIKERHVDEDTLKIAKGVAGFIDVASNLVTYNPLYKGIIENQLGNTLIVNNIDTMNLLGKKINYRYRIISLDGELLHTGGAMSGGIAKNANGVMNYKFELEKLNRELNGLENEIKAIEEHSSEIDQELKILEENIFNKRGAISSIEETLKQKGLEIDEAKRQLDNITNELKDTNNILDNATDKELDKVLKEYLEVSTNKNLYMTKLDELKSTKNDLANEINEIELENRKKNSDYNRKASEIKDIEISIGKMDVKLDTLLNRLSEEYQMTYDKAINNYSLDLEENLARSKVNQLKRDIKDLGEVNLGSIAEYERVNSRYTYLSDQRNDLNNAVNNLMEIINDLDETMKQRFAKTFEDVNQEFTKVFRKLFKGGNAKLVLTDPDDMLLTGVDIIAEPPGKSLKTITALSGGEMTLTAIALLFSVLNIRTVPFCILDEVEAALDEANVDQFGNYIKEYENNSQFIVITHKKRTMEYANTLYGITMQESGVSKLVSVRLENVE